MSERWSEQKAWKWFDREGFHQGANFVPSTASSQLQMWLEFDEEVIRRELEWASRLNYNAIRVFLHNLMWKHEGQAFLDRVDRFLDIASSFKIKTMLVLFDGCWDPHPKYGPQPPLRPHVHNGRWVQAPGAKVLVNSSWSQELQPYVEEVFKRFGNDSARVLLFDLFNEPDNDNGSSYGHNNVSRVEAARDAAGTELNSHVKANAAFRLVFKTHKWARAVGPFKIPLTVPLYYGSRPRMTEWILNNTDVLSFHDYGDIHAMNQTLERYSKYGRPLICSEYMARNTNSTFDPILGFLKNNSVWAFNWGLVSGATQTNYPWNSWQVPYEHEPVLWQHDVLRRNGTPYLEAEFEYIEDLWLRQANSNMLGTVVGTIVVVLLVMASVFFIAARRHHLVRYRQHEILQSEEEGEVPMEESKIVIIENRMMAMD